MIQPAFCLAADDDAIKINKLIAHYATQLNVGTVSLNWLEQPEVKKLRSSRPKTNRCDSCHHLESCQQR